MPVFATKARRTIQCDRPWNGANAGNRGEKYIPIHFPDAQSEIDRCINCPLPASKCNGNGDCYATQEDARKVSGFGNVKRHGHFNEPAFERALEEGLNVKQIAMAFHVTTKTVRNWGRKYGYDLDERRRIVCDEQKEIKGTADGADLCL